MLRRNFLATLPFIGGFLTTKIQAAPDPVRWDVLIAFIQKVRNLCSKYKYDHMTCHSTLMSAGYVFYIELWHEKCPVVWIVEGIDKKYIPNNKILHIVKKAIEVNYEA